MRSIRPRFLVISAVVITLAMIATAFAFTVVFQRSIERRVDDELTNLVNQIAAGLEFNDQGKLLDPIGLNDVRFDTPYGGLYWQIDDPEVSDQRRSRSLWDTTLELPDDTHDAGEIHRYDLAGPESTKLFAQERTLIISTPTGARTIRVSVAIDRAEMTALEARFAWDMLPYLGVLGFFLLGASAVQLALGLKPLSRISGDVTALASSPGRRLDADYPSEVGHLVDAVNGLLDSQQAIIERSRSQAADLAHGLKTPLTVITNNAGKLREQGNDEIADELCDLVKAMEARINHELARVRIAPRPEHRVGNADLYETVSTLIRTLSKTPQGEVIEWQTNVPTGLGVAVDPNDFRELLGNILENAVKWASSTVTVNANRISGDAGDIIRLTIEDDGPGIDPAAIESMSVRGKRFDENTPGTGLGLAIVADIAEVYGLQLAIQNRQTTGLSVSLSLPIAR